jgi:hypothetical protein
MGVDLHRSVNRSDVHNTIRAVDTRAFARPAAIKTFSNSNNCMQLGEYRFSSSPLGRRHSIQVVRRLLSGHSLFSVLICLHLMHTVRVSIKAVTMKRTSSFLYDLFRVPDVNGRLENSKKQIRPLFGLYRPISLPRPRSGDSSASGDNCQVYGPRLHQRWLNQPSVKNGVIQPSGK